MSRRVVLVVGLVAVVASVLLQPLGGAAAAPSTVNCSASCGSISISYPFGIEPGCYRDGSNLTCDHAHQPPKTVPR